MPKQGSGQHNAFNIRSRAGPDNGGVQHFRADPTAATWPESPPADIRSQWTHCLKEIKFRVRCSVA